MSAGLADNPTQKLICVDTGGKETGRIVDRKTAHKASGMKHLAIQVLVFTPKQELVLHERPLKKIGGGVLDAPTTHVLAGESKEEAAARCLKNEYGIENVQIKILGGFSYENDYGDGSCENEYCLAAFTVFSGKINHNKEHAGKIVKLPAAQVLRDLKEKPDKYPVWFAETVKIVEKGSEGKKLLS